jgi:hypothetical protein
MSNLIAPDGQVFVCNACGKESPDHYGTAGDAALRSPGWDESCVLHAVLCWRKRNGVKAWYAVEAFPNGAP